MATDIQLIIRKAEPSEFEAIGSLLVQVYSQLNGFPKINEQPEYYNLLRNVGQLTIKPATEILGAFINTDELAGAVVVFYDMQFYGSGGTATKEKNAGGFRLLAVDPKQQGKGIGKLLTMECIQRITDKKLQQVIIHSTKAMKTAWSMYENMGFKRSTDLDFMQGKLPVFGFRLNV